MKKVLILSLGLHFFYSIIYNAYLTWDNYLSFYGKDKKESKLYSFLDNFTQNKISRSIARYTGAETGFGFFAPNVLTSSVIAIEKNGKVIIPSFSNHENEIRYTNLASGITSRMLEPSSEYDTMRLKKPVLGKYTTREDADSAYYNLIFKNIAAPYMGYSTRSKDTITIKLLLYDYPSLKSYAASNGSGPEFVPLFTTKIALKNSL